MQMRGDTRSMTTQHGPGWALSLPDVCAVAPSEPVAEGLNTVSGDRCFAGPTAAHLQRATLRTERQRPVQQRPHKGTERALMQRTVRQVSLAISPKFSRFDHGEPSGLAPCRFCLSLGTTGRLKRTG